MKVDDYAKIFSILKSIQHKATRAIIVDKFLQNEFFTIKPFFNNNYLFH